MRRHEDGWDHDAVARLERETAPLARLVAEAAEARLDASETATARFHEWLARDLRARERPGERLAPERLALLRARVHALAHAERLGVRLERAAPSVREDGGAWSSEAGPWNDGSAARPAPWLDLAVAAGVGREIWDEPCERWVEVPDVVPRGEYLALSVSGDSMLPLFHQGDVVLVRRGAEVARGSVIVARHPDDGYVIKEVARVGRREIELRSLNPVYGPVTIPRAAALVVGTVVLRWCAHDDAALVRRDVPAR